MKQNTSYKLLRVSNLFVEDTKKLSEGNASLYEVYDTMTKVIKSSHAELASWGATWCADINRACRRILRNHPSNVSESELFLTQRIVLVLRGQEGDTEAMRLAGIQPFGQGRKLGKAKNAARRKAAKDAAFEKTRVENGSGAQREFQEAQLRQWNNWRRSPTLVGKEVPPHLIGMCKH